jgi:hypothetical protein
MAAVGAKVHCWTGQLFSGRHFVGIDKKTPQTKARQNVWVEARLGT